MPKGTPKNGKRAVNKVRMVDCTIKLPPKVKANLTTKEKRTLLQIGEHEKSMMDLEDWCNKMLNKINQIK